ncbi:hypothetical protein Hdeb2414_s1357g01024351 [Helianthus debilis subsp. tardiflorus]
MKWVGLLLVWIRQNRSIRKYIQANKYLVLELKNSMSMAGIFSIFLLVTCVHYLGRIPSPIFSTKLNMLEKMEEEEEFDNNEEEEFDNNEEEEFDNNKTVDYMYGNQENLKFKILEKKQKDEEKNFFLFEKPILTFFFDYNRWNRPLRYIRKINKKLKGSVRKEASQYFFYTCQSDGKQRISFTYPPSLSTFGEMIARRISLSTLEKISPDELYTEWVFTNKEKKNNLNNEFINRIEALETVFLSLNILEAKTRLSNAETKNKNNCLVKMYDPFLNGMYRGRMKKLFSSSIINETSIENCTETAELNKIHDILLPYPNSPENEQKIERSEKKKRKIDSNNGLKFSLNEILTNPKREKKYIGINEIGKKPPRWSYKLINELEQYFKKRRKEQGIMQGLDHQLRTRKFKHIAFLTRSERSFKKSHFKNYNLYRKFNRDSGFISYLEEPDFRRAVIKDSMRVQRRKMVIWGPSQGNPHSPLFLEKMEDFPFPISDLMKLFFNIRDWLGKKSEFEILDQQFQIKKNNQEDVIEFWENIPYAQKSRSVLLLAQSIFRRYIKLPLLIIAKNIGRILLRQSPEWYEDFQDWNREIYLKCNYNGLQFSKTEFPKNWLIEGFQIKILYPFHLKPWHRSKLRLSDRDRKQQDDFDSCFLTVLGMETEYPFGPPRKTPSFFEPIFKDIDYKVEIRKFNFRIRRALKKIKKKEAKVFFFVKQILKELLKGKKIPLFITREIYESNETEREKDSIISNKIIHESLSQNRPKGLTNYSQTEEEMKHRIDRRNTIRNQIEIMKKNKKTVTLKKKINKKNNGEALPTIWKILKRNNIELIVKIFIEKIYIDIFLCIINMRRIALQLFMESTKKIIEKYIDNNETNKEKINKTKQNQIDFISTRTIKKAFDNLRNSKRKSNIFFELSYLSQKYVFLKLSQTQVIHFNKLRSILQYNGPSFFLKNEIKDFFGRQGIFDYEVRHKKLPNSGMNPWKNWLRGHYQYDLSQITWSRLVPQKWRNGKNQCQPSQNKDLNKWYSYEKDQLFDYKKKQNLKVYLLSNKEENFQKNYRYDRLSYKYIHSETNKKSYIYRSSLEPNKKQENSTRNKEKTVNILKNIPIKNYLGKSDIIYMEKNTDRKYLGWKLNTNIQVESNKDQIQIRDKIPNNGLFYLPIYSNSEINYKRVFFDWMGMPFDWMGMNEKFLILNRPISNPKFFLFPEFLILYHKYKEKPWFIPSNLLLFNLNINPNFNENQNIKGKHEEDEDFFNFSPSNSKQYFELKNQNNIEESLLESIEKLQILIKGDFPLQLRWTGRLNQLNQKMMNNIQIYGLLVSLINVRKISISYIQRKEMNLDIMRRRLNLTQLTKKGN